MEEIQKERYTTRSKTQQCYLKRDVSRIEKNYSIEQQLKQDQSSVNHDLSLTILSNIVGSKTHNKNRVVTSRPLTVELLSMYQKELRDWHRQRKKNMLDQRQALRTKQLMAVSPLISTVVTVPNESSWRSMSPRSRTNRLLTTITY